MQVFRFDPEVSIPVDRDGSDLRIGRLTDENTRGRIEVLYLSEGGRLGRHRADGRRLLAVVSGSGWVSGADASRRTIRSGQAVVWEPDEEQQAGTDDGLIAICIDGKFEMSAVAVTREIVVTDYDQAWEIWFEELRAYLWPAVRDLVLRIDHVGSTSVPGMAAKPIIDMDIVVADDSQIRPVIAALAPLGYQWVGDMGVAGREAFDTRAQADRPQHHLYLVVENNKAHLDHVLLRDLLLRDPEARTLYSELKRANVELAQGDIDVYVAAKAALVAELLTTARQLKGLEPATYWTPESTGTKSPPPP